MSWTRTYEGPEPQRVNRWLAQSGVCSRREAEALIAEGLVSIDGQPVTDSGRKIAAGQTLTLADAAEAQLGGALTVMVHKPVGVVSAHPEPGQVPASSLLTADALWTESPWEARIAPPGPDASLPPVGRLDRDSRGLLLLSSDGVVAKAVIGPASDLDKEYEVKVAGEVTDRKLQLLRHGLTLDSRQLRPARVTEIAGHHLRMILKEGRNRQISRMWELLELQVVYLHRVRIGTMRQGYLN